MWVIRWVLITALVLALVGFMGQNQDEMVDIKFFMWETPRMALAYALFLAFGVGVIVHMLIAVFRQLQLRSEIGRQKRQIRKLQEEIDQLRNLPIEEELFPDETGLSRPDTGSPETRH